MTDPLTIVQAGNIAGNYYGKYAATNPIVRRIMAGFLTSFDRLVSQTGAKDAHEVGCGEGELSLRLSRMGLSVRGCDISPAIVEQARATASRAGKSVSFAVKSIYELEAPADAATLLVCCEVLEHVPDPEPAMEVLAKLAQPYLLASVPREPLWRILNMVRLKYIRDCGNTPGHVQHWSRRGFLDLLAKRFEVVAVETPVPWTMALCRVR